MKIEPRQVEAFLNKPDSRIRAVVIYGNDDGLIAERALALARTVCEDLKDPFRVVDIAGDALRHHPVDQGASEDVAEKAALSLRESATLRVSNASRPARSPAQLAASVVESAG